MTEQHPSEAKPVDTVEAREPWVAPEIASFTPAKAAEAINGVSGDDGVQNIS